MRRVLTIFFVLMSSILMADDGPRELAGFDPRMDIISDNYEAGAFLIYDCVEKHWVCVLESYFKECQEKRVQNILENKPTLDCAALGEFPVKKSCFQRQLYMTTHNHGTRFCENPEWKENLLKF